YAPAGAAVRGMSGSGVHLITQPRWPGPYAARASGGWSGSAPRAGTASRAPDRPAAGRSLRGPREVMWRAWRWSSVSVVRPTTTGTAGDAGGVHEVSGARRCERFASADGTLARPA